MLRDIADDPFNERSPRRRCRSIVLLGARFRFDSDSPALLRLVAAAYQGLPRHRLTSPTPDMRVTLLLGPPGGAGRDRREPPPLSMVHGAGLFGGSAPSSNFVILSPRAQAALVVVSPQMLRFAYHTRYEMIEFAVFTLAARAQQLVPLHAACVGRGGRGILLLGPSGAGKSTVAMLCLLAGFDFLAEDSVFVDPQSMLATGIPNFLHIRASSLKWIGRSPAAASIRRSPIIRRRSGVRKFEVDLRRRTFRLARSPLKIVSIVFLSEQSAGTAPLLKPLSASRLLADMNQEQGYAARQPQWRLFARNAAHLKAFELRRGGHPLDAVDALETLLAGT